MNLNDGVHYNWEKTLSYNADVTCVVGAPNKGKTFGLRAYALSRARSKENRRFVEICRTLDERDSVKHGYFDKLLLTLPELEGCEFKCVKNQFLIKEDGAEDWYCVGYIVAMAEMQRAKKSTFVNVENIIMDEAIIESIDAYHRYRPDEWNVITRLVDSLVREDVEDGHRVRPRVFLLGNSVDLINPTFAAFGVKGIPRYGYTWYREKMCLLHYVEPDENDEKRRRETLAGRMGEITGYTARTYSNKFAEDMRYIAKKPPRARYIMGVVHLGAEYGIWMDITEGYYYVSSKIPNNAGNVFSLTRADNTPNRIAAKKTARVFKTITEMYYEGSVLFESPRVREGFLDAMRLYGVR